MAIEREKILNLVSDTKYHKLINKKLDELEDVLIDEHKIILEENDHWHEENSKNCYGKVRWVKAPKGQLYKVPKHILINVTNLDDIYFLAIFLHECGHVKDRSNESIRILSDASERSAWSHAIRDFDKYQPSVIDLKLFLRMAKKLLHTYDIDINSLDELRTNPIN